MRFATLFLVLSLPLAAQQQQGSETPAALELTPLAWRNVGPFRGGRVSAVAGNPAEPTTFYMGGAGGGIFKTTNSGATWRPVSDGFVKTGSVGALAVAPSNPSIVYAGMGEHTARANTTHHGDGVYKSIDAGRTWKHMGLAATQVISRIRVHPRNPDLVYIAAQGALYGPTDDRGIYRSNDGGQTWKRIHFVGPTVGASDLAMDPTNPDILYAAYWDHQRTPAEVRAYRPQSGIYKSTDAGETWQKLSTGLPATMGKVSVATTSNTNRVYALLGSREPGGAGLYRSDDAGATWQLTNSADNLVNRMWYYIELATHPTNPDIVWVMNSGMSKSEDGGRTFRSFNTPHADRHDFWVNPTNPNIVIIGDDGGAAVSQDGGRTWSSQNNQATSQIYRVVTDNRFPYWLYGAQQDNATIAIPNASAERGGMEREWHGTAGYENSFLAIDPDNPDLVYGTNILGEVEEQSQSTGISRSSAAQPLIVWGNFSNKYQKYRYVLNTPVFISKHAPKTLYLSANKLLASDDRGQTWREASPDLTLRGSDSARNKEILGTAEIGDGAYGAIVYATESPLRKGVLWTGSDDGIIGVTRDGGLTWHKTQLPGVGDARINTVAASPHDPAVGYAAATRFQFNDYTPYFFRTADYGRTWTRIGADLPMGGWARVIREDPVRKGLLYAGTETGVFFSLDEGTTWRPLQNNLPATPVYDLVVHPTGDLVVATGGRAFWVFDDVSVLRQMAANGRETALKLYQPRPAFRSNIAMGGGGFGGGGGAGAEPTSGQNPPGAALLQFYLPRKAPVTIEISNAAGAVVRRLVTADDPDPRAAVIEVNAGLNRIPWDLRQAAIPQLPLRASPGQGRIDGKLAAPGTYTIKLTAGGASTTARLEVRAMPGISAPALAYTDQEQTLLTIERDLSAMRDIARRAESVRQQLTETAKKLADSALVRDVNAQLSRLVSVMDVYAPMVYVHARVNTLTPQVRASSRDLFATLHRDWEALRPGLERALGADLDALNAKLTAAGQPAIKPNVPPDRRQGRGGAPDPSE